MIEESTEFQVQIIWFTTIIGKKSSVLSIKKELLKMKVVIKETRLNQGKQTR